ncbi:MAG: CHAT domain-containing protein, partial [Candidatus Latescibacterota bacterium]
DYAGAARYHLEALEIRRKALGNDHPDVASSLDRLATLRRAQGDYAGAARYHLEALEVRRKTLGSEHPDVAVSLANLGVLLHDQGDLAKAERLYRDALGIHQKVLGDDHPYVASSLTNLGALLHDQGDYAGAELLFRDALAIRRKTMGNDHPDIVWSLGNLGVLLYAKGDYAEAEKELSEATKVYDTSRLRAGAGVERVTFRQSPYAYLAAARLKLGKTDEAWPAIESHLGRALVDLLTSFENRPLTETEAAREDSLLERLGDLERKIYAYEEASLTETAGVVPKSMDNTRNRLFATEAEWARFQTEIQKKYPVSEGKPFELEMVQSALDDETAILGWLDAREQMDHYSSWAYVIHDRGPVVWVSLESPGGTTGSPLDRMMMFRERISTYGSGTQAATRTSKGCWQARIEPLSDALDGTRHLIVLPSGAMIGVPIEAFVDDEGRYLVDRFTVSYIPSATIYKWLEQRSDRKERAAAGKSLLLGDPPFQEAHLHAMENEEGAGVACGAPRETHVDVEELRSALTDSEKARSVLWRLPCTRLEVEGIARMLPDPTLLVGAEATESELSRLAELDHLDDYAILHFATHALVDAQDVERSALILSLVDSPGSPDATKRVMRIFDGMLTTKEIVHEWRLDADLVTLSACETGLGKIAGGEGLVGFAHSFLQVGARSLLVSLWKVDDQATSILMQRFYENWIGKYEDSRLDRKGKSMSKAEALQEAKQYLRDYTEDNGERPFEHPCFWSAFILIGDRG